MDILDSQFEKVPAINTPAYFWFINFEMDPEELLGQLHDMYDKKVRNVCLHPVPQNWRPGTYLRTEMTPDYLTEEYFQIIKLIVNECEKLGIHYYLYDEGGWPSGSACGQVLAKHPEWKRSWITCNEAGNLTVVEEEHSPNRAMIPDLLIPGATEEFISLTHQAHLNHLGSHIGSTVKVSFMDEPAIAVSSDKRLTWTKDFAEEFKRRKGYDITPHIKSLLHSSSLSDEDELVEKRIDFHDVRTQLFIERFMKPIQDWCHKNNMLSGGHFDGEDSPEQSCRRTYGAILKSLRYLDVPGVDVIWRQIWPSLREHSFPRFASSVAHQEGKTWSLGELFGVYGNGLTPLMLRYVMDYMFVHGINLLVLGSYPQRNIKNWLAGCRPHFGPDDPLWQYFEEYHTYASRASYLLSCGSPLRTTALVFDNRSLWADNWNNVDTTVWTESCAQRLREKRILFDYIDEDVIAQSSIEGNELVYKSIRYKELVVHSRRRLIPEAEAKIQEFIAAGGVVVNSPEDLTSTINLSFENTALWVEARKLNTKENLYFFFNSSSEETTVNISCPNTNSVILVDPIKGKSFNVKIDEKGYFKYTFNKYDTAFFITNKVAKEDLPTKLQFNQCRYINDNWFIVPAKQYFIGDGKIEIKHNDAKAIPAKLGDWREILPEEYSGNVNYECEFYWQEDIPKKVVLDFGKVNYCCQLFFNGQEYDKIFRGPFEFDITNSLQKGVNKIKLVVTNTLANAYSPREVELKMEEMFPPRSGYESKQRGYERESLASGLFGPVAIKY